MKDRISQIMNKKGFSATQFAEKIGISASSLSHILNGRNNPSLDVVMRIHKAFETINTDWLIYGTGPMESTPIAGKDRDLFSMANAENLNSSSNEAEAMKNRKETMVKQPENTTKEFVRQEIRYVEKPLKQITEIRIFFDNGTYETFKPA
ncbi:helix-turn-helix domain-containing protein [Phocaeicola abscessus]|uniref:helix-turn-helix domain-containing protein n=1 Tax=Phocaeicola abscessus TaxID=555313 RepID=UPI0006846A5E|nr:helix-turn-helix transcriptional regulator [Phocaeicola abscessus]